MVSFAQLRDARIDELDAAWRAWRKLVEHLEQAEDTYQGRFLEGVRSSRWQGQDAQAAMRTLVPVRSRIRVAAGEASAIASVLNTAKQKFKTAQLKLRSAISSAESQYLKVGDDGSIDFPDALPPRYSSWQELEQVARRIQGQFQIAVKEATDADTQIAAALRALAPDALNSRNPQAALGKDARMATKLAGFDAAGIPPANAKDPKAVAAWWKSLPEEQRHLMMNAFPEKIGWLNGIPSEDRDEANRTRLAGRLAELQAKGGNLDAFERRDLARLNKLDDAISNYEARGKDMYVLGFDSTIAEQAERRDGKLSDGRVIVAFGNPDTAKHSAVYVPGTESSLDKFDGSMHRAFNLYEAASIYTEQPVSTVAWLGYDAPDHIAKDAPFGNYADAGGPKLNNFIDGMRAAQAEAGNSGSHMTAVGHSYGSTVLGEAARHADNRLPVDDIVVAGSPGMRVAKAEDLGIGADHVWVQEAQGDPVGSVGRVGHGGPVVDGLGPAGPVRIPSDPGFEGQRLATDGHGHSDYWNDIQSEGPKNGQDDPHAFKGSSLSLEQQGKVVAGAHNDQDPSNDPLLYGQGGPGEKKDEWWQRVF